MFGFFKNRITSAWGGDISLTKAQKIALLQQLPSFDEVINDDVIKIQAYINTLETYPEDFDQIYDKLIFGFLTYFCRYLDEHRYGHAYRFGYPVSLSKLVNAEPVEKYAGYPSPINIFITLGEHILNKKTFPFTNDIIKKTVSHDLFQSYLLTRITQYETLDYESYTPFAIRRELTKLAPDTAKYLFETLDIHSPECDHLVAALSVWDMAKDFGMGQQRYPLSRKELYERAGVSIKENPKDFLLTIGSCLFDEKSLPLYVNPYQSNFLSNFFAKRFVERGYLSLEAYSKDDSEPQPLEDSTTCAIV